jgi:hypothetical protein
MDTGDAARAAGPGAEVARTLADAALIAELMADLLRAADEAAGGDAAIASRLLRERLVRRRREDGELLAVLRWFAATHDVAAARAAIGWTPGRGGWRPPQSPGA